ncbi:MAG: YbdD/YjiX family protein [Gemmatimonadaceae bacterium]|nr:YbdD/YjiX family protein [Gemmatimonadaceae bacterium]
MAAVIRRIIGVPDYEAYVAHVRAHHPEQEPMSERDFHREQLAARYSRPGSRCC